MVINGRSWPHTERLGYQVGDTVRMRLINAGAAVHPMHLHGFYFNVDSRGDERADTVFRAGLVSAHGGDRAPGARSNVLAHVEADPAWKLAVPLSRQRPSRAGRAARWRDGAADVHRHVENHALEMMAGPVMGITVSGQERGARTVLECDPPPAAAVARVDQGGTEAEPAFGYTLHTGSTSGAPPPPYLPGPTIVLKRGEPVSITVVNELPEPTAVHWHGIELESYYDGVAGYAGEGQTHRARDSDRRVVRGALHAAALGHVHLSHARRRGPAAAGRAVRRAARRGRSGALRP